MKKIWVKKIVYALTGLAIIAIPPIMMAQTNPKLLATEIETRVTNLQIVSVSYDIDNRETNVGKNLTVTIKGTGGVRASILILGDKQRIQEYQAQETTPGVYVANIILNQRDRVTEGAIIARLQQGTEVIYGAAAQPFAVNPSSTDPVRSAPDVTEPTTNTNRVLIPLAITSHQNGEQVASNNLTIRGQTQPNAEVQIKIASSLSLVGNLIQIEGDSLVDRIVNADNKGNFAITVPQSLNAPQGLQYLVSAIAFSENGQSRTVELTLISN